MTKLVRDQVRVSEEEIRACYDAHYGEKIDCKMIYWPKGEKEVAIKVWSAIRDANDKDRDGEFDAQARKQAEPRLAAQSGHLEAAARPSHGRRRRAGAASFSASSRAR